MLNTNQNKARVSILISDKVEFRAMTTTRDWLRGLFHNDKGVDSLIRCKNSKHLCI